MDNQRIVIRDLGIYFGIIKTFQLARAVNKSHRLQRQSEHKQI